MTKENVFYAEDPDGFLRRWYPTNFELQRQIDRYGIALMLIREGGANPKKLAADVLNEFAPQKEPRT